MIRKNEGFKDQKGIVLPNYIQDLLKINPLTKLLFITDIGYYPDALYHFRERVNGCEQHILIYCVKGQGWLETGGVRKKVGANQFFIIPAEESHIYEAENTDPWSIYWVHFSGEMAQHFAAVSASVRSTGLMENSPNKDRISLFEEAYQNLLMGYSKENLEYSSICLWHLLGSFQFIVQFERIKEIKRQDIIEKGILYMKDRLGEKINLKDLASHCGLSASHYSMVFKKKTTHSPIDYFISLKIQMACQWLDFTDLQIKEIASKLAFDDQFYFSRIFKKVMGSSPLEYRKNKKG